jgi:hypothetical protein
MTSNISSNIPDIPKVSNISSNIPDIPKVSNIPGIPVIPRVPNKSSESRSNFKRKYNSIDLSVLDLNEQIYTLSDLISYGTVYEIPWYITVDSEIFFHKKMIQIDSGLLFFEPPMDLKLSHDDYIQLKHYYINTITEFLKSLPDNETLDIYDLIGICCIFSENEDIYFAFSDPIVEIQLKFINKYHKKIHSLITGQTDVDEIPWSFGPRMVKILDENLMSLAIK